MRYYIIISEKGSLGLGVESVTPRIRIWTRVCISLGTKSKKGLETILKLK